MCVFCCCRGCCSCEWYEEGEKGNHQPEVRARRTLSMGRQFGRPAVSVCAGSLVTHTSGLPVWRANNTSSLVAVACASNPRLGDRCRLGVPAALIGCNRFDRTE